MVEQQRQRVEQEMTKLVDDLDRQYLRKMQYEMHKCAMKCCENSEATLDRVQQCVEKCSIPLHSAQNYVQNELESLQKRLQRCVMECNDMIKDKMGPNPSDADVAKYTSEFDSCAVRCVDKHVQLIPTCKKNIMSLLAKGIPNQNS